MYQLQIAAAVALTAASAFAGQAAPPAPSPEPAPAIALAPSIQDAMKALSADDFKTRQAALGKLELALGDQTRELLSSDDPEVQSRIAELLQFNDGLTRWALDALKLPPAQQKAQLDFGLKPEVLPVITNVYSSDVGKRVEGVKGLGKLKSDEATALLTRLLDDQDRAVYVAAMEAVWDRKPTDGIVDSLWKRAVESMLTGYRQQPMMQLIQQKNVVFRGKAINGGVVYTGGMYPGQDAGIACDVLINLKAPQLDEKMKAFALTLEKMSQTNPWIMNNNNEQIKNYYRLIETYKPKEAIAALYGIATGPLRQRIPMQINADKIFRSNRTTALALVIAGIGQKPEDYQLKQSSPMGGIWVVSTEEEENDAVKKLQTWMVENGAKFGIKPEAATQPATQEAPANPPLQGGMGGGIQFKLQAGQMQIQIAPQPAASQPDRK